MKSLNRKTILPIIVSIIIATLSYSVSKSFVDVNKIIYVNIFIDDYIPLFAPIVIVYILAYLQWIVVTCILFKQETKLGYQIALTFIICSVLMFLIYTTFPTGIIRPNIKINNIFDKILSHIYLLDSPINVFPSFHCFGSTISIISLNRSKNIERKYRIINVIFSIIVYVSTLLTKQHYIVDVPAGILITYLGYILATKIIDIINK